jgi:hypothetical protein
MRAMVQTFGIAVAGLCLTAASVQAQEHLPAVPGPVHQRMAKLAGEYTTVAKFAAKPGDPGQDSRGTAKLTSVLGGRFVQEENGGNLVGQAYAGQRLYGYNDASGQYEAVWVYTGSNAIMTLTGTSTDEGKTINWTANFDVAKGRKVTLIVKTRFLDPDLFVVELIAKNPDGSLGALLETTYTRKK